MQPVMSHDLPAENQAFRVVAAVLLPSNFGPYMLGYQSSCQAAGHGCREPAVHCKERTVLHGGHQGDALLLRSHASLCYIVL